MISKNRPTKGKIGVPYHIENLNKSKYSCGGCIYFEKEDGSCSLYPIVLSEIGFDYYKSCKSYEKRKNLKDDYKEDIKIARLVRISIENKSNLKHLAKTLNKSLYEILDTYNRVFNGFMPMNEENIKKLRSYGLKDYEIARLYNISLDKISIKANNTVKNSNDRNNIKITDEKVINNQLLVIEASDGICYLCNKVGKGVNIHCIDENKNKDSILNMAVLCNKCIKLVRKDSKSYVAKLNNIANEKLDKIIELA